MSELIGREAANRPHAFTGERLTAAISGQVEIEHYHRYLLAREFCRGRDVLDVASGEGYGTALLAQVARSAVGIEIDADTVTAARAEFRHPNLRYEQGDARALPLPNASIDVAVSFETLEHLAEQDVFLSELHRVLRPDGLLIISTPDRDIYSPPGATPNPFHVLELTKVEFRALLHRHFTHSVCAGQRALIGSLILGTNSEEKVLSYERHGEALFERSESLARAPYVVAFASDAPLPPLPNSVYVHRSDLDTDPNVRLEAELAASEALARVAVAEQATFAALARATAAEAQTAELVQRLDGIETSSIWRATRPLRSLGQRFPFLALCLRRCTKLVWWTVTLQLPRRYKDRHDNRGLRTQSSVKPTSLKFLDGPALQAKDISVSSSDEPIVSVIISTYGQLRVTLACLQSIAYHVPRSSIEVIVVDDAYSGPDDMSELHEVAGIRVIRNATNVGFLRSCNRAAGTAKGRYIYMLNNDTELQPGAIDALVDLLDARKDVGMVGSKLLFPNGLLQEAGGILWADASGWNYGRGQNPSRPEYNYVREVDYCSGASIMVHRALFEMLEGFDEEFAPAYYEDTDLAFRIRAKGLKVLYAPRSVVVHHEGVSHGTNLAEGVKAHQIVNQSRMLERWEATLRKENYANGQHVLRARDRARSRKVILVIDHYVPEPDRDAGSRSILGIMDSLLDAGWVVKFWPHNRIYSSGYTIALEQRGIEVLDHRWPGDLSAWLRENGSELDHLLVVRPTVAVDVLPHLLNADDAAIRSFYGVDLHFSRMRRQADLDGNIELHNEAIKMEKLERRIWRHFDVVIYPSEEEATTVRRMSPSVLARGIVPFCFDTSPARTVPANGHTILFVAGFAHAPNADAAAFLVNKVLPPLKQAIGAANVILAGSNPTAAVQALAGPDVVVTGYVTDEVLAELYDQCRVSVVPLRFGAGVKGKVVESLSHGLPLVSTSIGVEGMPGLSEVIPVRDDVPGIVAALKLLLTDDAAWMAQSAMQTDFAQRFFSRTVMQKSVLSALEAGEIAVSGGPIAAQVTQPIGNIPLADEECHYGL
jgi:O-antigen biosynthesis protein